MTKNNLKTLICVSLLSLSAFAGRDVEINPEDNKIYSPDAVNLILKCGKEVQKLVSKGFKAFYVSQQNVQAKQIDAFSSEYAHKTIFYFGKNREMGTFLKVESLTAEWKEKCLGEQASDGGCSEMQIVSCKLKVETYEK